MLAFFLIIATAIDHFTTERVFALLGLADGSIKNWLATLYRASTLVGAILLANALDRRKSLT